MLPELERIVTNIDMDDSDGPVEIYCVSGGRPQIFKCNQGGYDNTSVDLFLILQWAQDHAETVNRWRADEKTSPGKKQGQGECV